MTVRIGLTGPIGCGKSTVARWLGERPGVVVIDADQVAREVVEPGEPALDAVIARFGRAPSAGRVARPGGARADRLRRPGRARATSRRSSIPRSGRGSWPRSRRAEARGATAVVIEAIKLVEGGLAALCDEVWLVHLRPGDPAGAARRPGRVGGGGATQRIASPGRHRSSGSARSRPAIIDTSGDPRRARASSRPRSISPARRRPAAADRQRPRRYGQNACSVRA